MVLFVQGVTKNVDTWTQHRRIIHTNPVRYLMKTPRYGNVLRIIGHFDLWIPLTKGAIMLKKIVMTSAEFGPRCAWWCHGN